MLIRSYVFKNLLIFIFLLPILEASSQALSKITLTKSNKTLRISNGLLGVIIPSRDAYQLGKPCPAPIQSFIYNNDSLSDNSFNELKVLGEVTGMNVRILTNSTAEVKVRVEYIFNKPNFILPNGKIPKGGEAGLGFYNCEIMVKRGEKSILIEEDSNFDLTYKVKISNGLDPDMARYRGWSSSNTKYGFENGGQLYRSEIDRGYPMDATVQLNHAEDTDYPAVVLWEPAGGEQNSGRYWQAYNSTALDNANMFGIFQGKPSRLIGGRSVGVHIQTASNDDLAPENPMTSIVVSLARRGPDNIWYPRKRFQWGAFISTRSDILSPEKQQPIANELNRVSGLGSVIRDYVTRPVKIVPAFYKGAVYMQASDVQKVCYQVKHNKDFYKKLVATDYSYKEIWESFHFPDSAVSFKNSLIKYADYLVHEYEYGEGAYLQKLRYWKGSNLFKYYALVISALFANQELVINNDEKKKLEQLVGLMARIVWDNNNVPMFDSAGVNFGPENMTYMYNNSGRMFFALLLADDPEFKTRARQAEESINNEIEKAVYSNGSSIGSPHYIQPTIDPILFSMLQLKQAGVKDLFKTNGKIEAFAKFYTQLLTPESVRFSNNRKLISFGDGSEESAATFALLCTGLKSINPSLSAELFSSFSNGPMRGSPFGSLGLAVDLAQQQVKKFTAVTSNYTGYNSHFRTGHNTKNESALWVLNGEGLYDHRNDDAGEIAIYALNAPLSLSRSSFYYPSATDAKIRSVVIPEVLFPEWNKAAQPIAGRSLTNRTWPHSESKNFASLGKTTSTTVSMSDASGKTWIRKINMLSFFEDSPVFTFYDSVSGGDASIWSLPMMSEGSIKTPVGLMTPQPRMYNNSSLKQLPDGTPVQQLKPGLSEFLFTGQNWVSHPSKGIDWRLYSLSSTNTAFSLADWGTTWQNTIEVNEYLATNKNPYSEKQQFIRLKSNKPFLCFLLPYAKGNNVYRDGVTAVNEQSISLGHLNGKIEAGANFYTVKNKETVFLALLSETGALKFEDFSISGGYSECNWNGNQLTVRVHGNTGIRSIKVPFHVKSSKPEKSISVNQLAGYTTILIEYKSTGLDLPNHSVGYMEYYFEKQ